MTNPNHFAILNYLEIVHYTKKPNDIAFVLVECRAWDELLMAPDCMKQGLLLNGWKTSQELNGTQEADQKNMLNNEILKYLNSSIHTSIDLNFR